MKNRAMVFSFVAVALFTALTHVPVVKAEGSPTGTILRYTFTEGQTRLYRYTMSIADGNSLDAELVMNLSVTVGKMDANGFAAVEVKRSLVSFRAKTQAQEIELFPGQDMTDSQTEPLRTLVSDILANVFPEKGVLQVHAFGLIREPASYDDTPWIEAFGNNPELFCPLFAAFVKVAPSPRVLPFWVNYPPEPLGNGDAWRVSPDELGSWHEALSLRWMLKGVNETSALIEQMPDQYHLHLTLSPGSIDWLIVYGESDLPYKPANANPTLFREEKCSRGASLTIDPGTGWIIRYESTTRALGEMSAHTTSVSEKRLKDAMTKTTTTIKTSIDSTITTVVELLQG